MDLLEFRIPTCLLNCPWFLGFQQKQMSIYLSKTNLEAFTLIKMKYTESKAVVAFRWHLWRTRLEMLHLGIPVPSCQAGVGWASPQFLLLSNKSTLTWSFFAHFLNSLRKENSQWWNKALRSFDFEWDSWFENSICAVYSKSEHMPRLSCLVAHYYE